MSRNPSAQASRGPLTEPREHAREALERIRREHRARRERIGGIVRRGRAWAPTAKSAVLVLAPLPLALAAVAALINDDVGQALLSGGALTCLWTAATLVFHGLAAEARYSLNEQAALPWFRPKLLSAAFTGIGVALAALAAGSPVAGLLVFVLLAVVGHVAFFGGDERPRRVRVADAEGIDRAEVETLLVQANRRLRGLEIAAGSIAEPDVRRRLAGVVQTGSAIVEELERRPAEASRARRFLNVYLDGAERVTAKYARAAASHEGAAPDREYDALLADIERAFSAQHRRLLERDRLALDVDIEVLAARLRREALADVENRS